MSFEIPNSVYAAAAKNAVQLAAERFPLFLKEQMIDGGTAYQRSGAVAPSSSKTLSIQSGNLYRSFTPKGAGNISILETTANGVTWEFGSSLIYASIHETGAFIKSKGKMEGYFWSVFKSTGNPYFKSLALTVKKNKGVNIPARPYFNPALNAFDAEPDGLQMVLEELFNEIKEAFDFD